METKKRRKPPLTISGGKVTPPLVTSTATLTSLSPNTAPRGFITFNCTGTNFKVGAEVLAEGVALPPLTIITWNSPTSLTVEPFNVTNPQVAMVTVRNPGETATSPLPFTVT